ncbi:ketosteroid isomerase-related protein [Roseibium sediminis]|uniref:ketosteroid isomerase-related protein n=1 Tax=Roseibium sediminis TaxID=1775174 RepID=UPI00123DA2AB|nr:ketosteroid isomerase-related protein [Roseibium sediminis]
MTTDPRALLEAYYTAFNAGETGKMVGLVTDDVVHDVNQGERRTGKEDFWAFNLLMSKSYKERLSDIYLMISRDGTRGAAEFIVHGTYLETAEGLPKATGQTYTLPAGTFFEFRDGKISRITTYYNLNDWIAQVSA